MPKPKPADCPHCEYDRRFPGFEMGGWLQQDNNGPIVPCPSCNDDGKHAPRIAWYKEDVTVDEMLGHLAPKAKR